MSGSTDPTVFLGGSGPRRSTGDPTRLGPYRILRPLGEGGMGAVYLGRHETTGEGAALKVVRLPDAETIHAIRREIAALASLAHPGIVPVLDHGLHEGMPWYAMGLIEGTTLRERVAAEGRDLRGTLTLVRRLCEPVRYLHGEGLVHRDLKPENVVLAEDYHPVLIDFGLIGTFAGATSREALEATGSVSGTVAYMAPEQGRGEAVDARADIYALGCILYELLVGHPPFQGAVAAVLYMHQSQVPQRPSALVPGIPEALDDLVMRLLEKEPRDRLGHADDVALRLLELGAEADPPRGPSPRVYLYRTTLAGREAAIGAVREALRRARVGEGRVVLVGGPSGIGKTRLANEATRDALGRRMKVLLGECVAVGGSPLEAMRKPLQEVADFCRQAGALVVDEVLGPRGRVLEAYEETLRTVPGWDDHPAPAELPPEAARLRVLESLVDMLGAMARRIPLCLVLDDLQWADDLALGFLEHLVRGGKLAGMRLLVLGTYRSDETTEALGRLASHPAVARIVLDRIDEGSVARMVEDMLALSPPPETLSRYLARESEGNPFFVAEYLRTAVAEGVLARQDGRWFLGRWDPSSREALPLPRSIHELVSRRLEGLSAAARDVLERAAVLGRELDVRLLEATGGVLAPGGLRELVRQQVIEEAGGDRVRFLHDKLREVAYGRIPDALRSRLHGDAAAAIEALGMAASVGPAALGRHWELAGARHRAAACYLEGARAAVERYAQDEAERLFRAFLRLAEGTSPEGVAARIELGSHVLSPAGRVTEAEQELDRAASDALELGDPALHAQALAMLGELCRETGRMERARSLLEEALATQSRLGDAGEQGRLLTQIANLGRFEGRMDEAEELYGRALELLRATPDRSSLAGTLGALALLHQQRGDLARARDLYEQALAIHRETGRRKAEGHILGNLGHLLEQQGRTEESEALAHQVLAIHREVGDVRAEGIALASLANVRHFRGDDEQARSLYEQALAIHRAAGDRRCEANALGNLANIHADRGERDQAQALYEQALAVIRELGLRRAEGIALGNLAILLQEKGDLAGSRALHEQALSLHREAGNLAGEGSTLADMAHLKASEGDLEGARDLYERALAIHRQVENRRSEGIVLTELARTELLSGMWAEARGHLGLALDILRAIGDRTSLARSLAVAGHLALASGGDAPAALEEARRLAVESGSTPEDVTGRAIASLARAVTAPEEGRKLACGFCPEDLPPCQLRWIEERTRGG